jgi:hypothetical protein
MAYNCEQTKPRERSKMAGDKQAVKNSTIPAVTLPGTYHAEPTSPSENKIFFNVPFHEKEVAKAAGLKWDNALRKLYAATTEIAEAFSASFGLDEAVPEMGERHYFHVPFLQKDRAKAMGMRFDGIRKCWFAETIAMAIVVSGVFRKIDDAGATNVRI